MYTCYIHCILTIHTYCTYYIPNPHYAHAYTIPIYQSLVVQARRDARFALDHQYDKRATFVKIIDEVSYLVNWLVYYLLVECI